MLAIDIRDLTKDYPTGFWRKRPRRALDRLTLSIEPGEIFGFLGPNGAGKTTTLKLLMQLIYPTAGTASILGLPAGSVALKKRIGYLPEHPYFYDYLSAEELLTYFASLFGYAPGDRRARVARLLDLVGIGAERRLALRKYSKGMLQRVGLAQALVNDPEVVFLDEPMSGLDPLGRRDARALIHDLRKKGCTVFFSSHILSDAETLCDRVAVLARGRLVGQGRVADLVAFEVRGWEMILSGIDAGTVEKLGPRVTKATEIAFQRYSLELAATTQPDRLLAEVTALGATLVSLNPIRETLEDYFVKHVTAGTDAAGAGPGKAGGAVGAATANRTSPARDCS